MNKCIADKVRENVEKEWLSFRRDELAKSTEQVFNEAYVIVFYDDIHNFICYGSDIDRFKDDEVLVMEKFGSELISSMFIEYMRKESSSTSTEDDIFEFIKYFTEAKV